MSHKNDEVARYSFLPWLRQGIAGGIKEVDRLNLGQSTGKEGRIKFKVALEINGDANKIIENNIKLFGPGDVKGINPRSVVRTDPRNWVTDYEPNMLPLIEFYDEEFPWRFTPAKADTKHRLRPWICLIVLTEDEFEDMDKAVDRLPGIKILMTNSDAIAPDGPLPKPSEVWAWAHSHVNTDLFAAEGADLNDAITELNSQVKVNSDMAISRLICPRKLKPNTAYHAFVIPTFETGRRNGLNEPLENLLENLEDLLAPAWGVGQQFFPVYYRWRFGTSKRGDFEYLVRLLEPRVLDKRVGIRPMNTEDPGLKVAGTDPSELGLEGALKTEHTKSTGIKPNEFQTGLTDLINLPEARREGSRKLSDSPENKKDPIITPPLYGRWHSAVKKLGETKNSKWIEELNLDPRHRAIAGFGTRAIQDQQEELMNQAWQQVEGIREANLKLNMGQLAIAVNTTMYVKNIVPLDPEQALSITSPLHSQILGSPVTIHQLIKNSALPLASVDHAFRRNLRPRGPVMKRIDPTGDRRYRPILDRINKREILAASPKKAPPQIATLKNLAENIRSSWKLPGIEFPKTPTKPGQPGHPGGFGEPGLPQKPLGPSDISGQPEPSRGMGTPRKMRKPKREPRPTPSGKSRQPDGHGIIGDFFRGIGGFFGRIFGGRSSPPISPGFKNRETIADNMLENKWTPDLINQIHQQSNFKITNPGRKFPDPTLGPDSSQAVNFRAASLELYEHLEIELQKGIVPTPDPLDINLVNQKILDSITPEITIFRRMMSFINIPASLLIEAKGLMDRIMKHPEFSRPMYEPLRDLSSELLVPNLNLIPQNTISLLETNPPFIEAYLVGLNHEMSRELLWREYPTDQRGSYFRQFWDVADVVKTNKEQSEEDFINSLKDIKPIHKWRGTKLGKNNNRPGTDEPKAVITIRGDLLKKYPTAEIFAVKAFWPEDQFKARELGEEEKYPMFHAKIDPDITFIGFDLTLKEARGAEERDPNDPGWYFVIKERSGEPRFGLDVAEGPVNSENNVVKTWNDLSWANLAETDEDLTKLNYIELTKGNDVNSIKSLYLTDLTDEEVNKGAQWGANAADMAHILYQVPVLIAVHGSEMLKKIGD